MTMMVMMMMMTEAFQEPVGSVFEVGCIGQGQQGEGQGGHTFLQVLVLILAVLQQNWKKKKK